MHQPLVARTARERTAAWRDGEGYVLQGSRISASAFQQLAAAAQKASHPYGLLMTCTPIRI